MLRSASIVVLMAVIVALPFIFRKPADTGSWRPGDPVVVVVTPHNEAIRREFARAFADWHAARYGVPAKVDWRAVGGTTEIMRYLAGEYATSFRAWWKRRGVWPSGGVDLLMKPPSGLLAASSEGNDAEMVRAYRETDDARAFGCGMDVFFGGGTYDHGKAASSGFLVSPWPGDAAPAGLLADAAGRDIIPKALGGEVWRGDAFFGATVSTFGICANLDRLADLKVAKPPASWADLADPAYVGQVGVADPTKSGSIAKAFEMIVQEQCRLAVESAGYTAREVEEFENSIGTAGLAPGVMPPGVPDAYQAAVEAGWLAGLRLVQRIGANARYFTDSASKVPIDVSIGDAAAGLAIDFYARYQSELSRDGYGRARMTFVTPVGGSSVSADPIALLRGAPNRTTAVRFIEFVLSEDGQKLWNYAPGTPGGPREFALRRLPIRSDFYPSGGEEISAVAAAHLSRCVDDLADPAVNPYAQAGVFTYRPRWTARHFGVFRDLVKAMCIDSGEELRAAWRTVIENGGPSGRPDAMLLIARMPDRPEPLTWRTVLDLHSRIGREELTREWAAFFRRSYGEAARCAGGGGR